MAMDLQMHRKLVPVRIKMIRVASRDSISGWLPGTPLMEMLRICRGMEEMVLIFK